MSRKFGIIAVALGAVAAVALVVYIAATRGPGGADSPAVVKAAEGVPADAIGFFALVEPPRVLEELGRRIPETQRKRFESVLGFVPFTAEGWRAVGLDLTAPIAVAFLDAEAEAFVALCRRAGEADDFAKFREGLARAGFDRRFAETSYGEAPALLHRSGEVGYVQLGDFIVVIGGDLDDLPGVRTDEDGFAQIVARLQALKPETSLAMDPAFLATMGALRTGDTVSYVSTKTAALHVKGDDDEATYARAFLGEIDGVGASLRLTDGEADYNLALLSKSGGTLGKLLRDVRRPTDAFDPLPPPALAGFHVAFDPAVALESVRAYVRLDDGNARDWERAKRELKEEVGLDLEKDILGAFSGDFGLLLGKLPSGPRSIDVELYMTVGVRDDAAAEKLLSAAAKGFEESSKVELRKEELGGATLYTAVNPRDGGFAPGFTLKDGRVWIAKDANALRRMLNGDGKSLWSDTRAAKVAAALRGDAQGAAFADIAEIISQVGGSMRGDERRVFQVVAPALSPFEFVSAELRGEGDTLSLTVSTRFDGAGLSARIDMGAAFIPWDEVFEEWEDERRRADRWRERETGRKALTPKPSTPGAGRDVAAMSGEELLALYGEHLEALVSTLERNGADAEASVRDLQAYRKGDGANLSEVVATLKKREKEFEAEDKDRLVRVFEKELMPKFQRLISVQSKHSAAAKHEALKREIDLFMPN